MHSLFFLTLGTIMCLLKQKKQKEETKKKKNTLPQLFQVSIPDMMVLFHFLSELIVLLSELLTESLQPRN